jgi:holo-[acyl-carrier protein] synthase
MTAEPLRSVLERLAGAGSGTSPRPHVGIDLVHIPRVRRLAEQHGQRWLADHFTERERVELAVVRSGRMTTIAGRLAAKEAFIKLLAPSDRLVPTRDVEVLRSRGGAPVVLPRGTALHQVRASGIDQWSLSITHEGEWAAAIAVGCGPALSDQSSHRSTTTREQR